MDIKQNIKLTSKEWGMWGNSCDVTSTPLVVSALSSISPRPITQHNIKKNTKCTLMIALFLDPEFNSAQFQKMRYSSPLTVKT